MAAHFSHEASLTTNKGAACVGRAAIVEGAQSFMNAFPELQVVMDDLRIEGGRTVYR